ncbi:alpha carbonic anhydrase [Scenedesmus sp. NREL 46B-D3]|nr:alpha carbonic anhydrase [Scenedesmus sp. NREL 46B-D3]
MAVNALAVLAFALFISQSSACVQVYGDRNEAAKAVGGHYTYSYNGQDWSSDFPMCRGQKQSPVFLPSAGAAARELQAPAAKATFSYGKVTNPAIVNNGHTLQVVLPADFQSDVRIPVKGDTSTATGTSVVAKNSKNNAEGISFVKATPAQFHFHTRSEHIVAGTVYPMEMHIVHFIKSDQLPACGDPGCPVVLGLLIALTNDESKVSPTLRRIINAMPLNEGENNTISGSINIDSLLPSKRTYLTYEPAGNRCTALTLHMHACVLLLAGILWNVLTTPKYISQKLFTRYLQAVGSYDCPSNTTEAAATTQPGMPAGGSSTGNGDFKLPPADAEGCVKLADGHNYRDAQPLAGRSILLAA